jgi:hypothetical protein|tara:strand:+ start:117 stop:239 length:123 start_codon:yes stop_codon:yes gene_type:complete
MDKLELFSNTMFLLIMGLLIWGLMGSEAWLWQLFAYFIGL